MMHPVDVMKACFPWLILLLSRGISRVKIKILPKIFVLFFAHRPIQIEKRILWFVGGVIG